MSSVPPVAFTVCKFRNRSGKSLGEILLDPWALHAPCVPCGSCFLLLLPNRISVRVYLGANPLRGITLPTVPFDYVPLHGRPTRKFQCCHCKKWASAVRSDYIQVEVDEPVAGHGSISTRDSVRSVASRARKTGIDVDGVPGPACILDDIAARSWHLPHIAYGPFTVRSGWIEVRNPLARTRRLAEFITSLQK